MGPLFWKYLPDSLLTAPPYPEKFSKSATTVVFQREMLNWLPLMVLKHFAR